ncbi:hypothetical protein C0J08_01640 [Marinomonas sp. CT5]|nr:hypothetical protein C0J08_01640 [Marinomonas sp. CT5]
MSLFPNIHFHKANNNALSIETFELHTFYERCHEFTQKNIKKTSPFTPHRVMFYTFLIINEGNIQHYVDGQCITLSAGDLLLICPHQVHQYVLPNRPAKGHIIFFTDSVWDLVKQNTRLLHWDMLLTQSHNIHKSDQLDITMLLSILQKEQNKATADDILQKHIFTSLIHLLMRHWPMVTSGKQTSKVDLFVRFNHHLLNHFNQSRDVIYYANLLGCSYKVLNNICKSITHLTAKNVIDNYVILEAKRMLLTKTQNTQSIAHALGFDESTNFVKFFKRHTGKTPKEYLLKEN